MKIEINKKKVFGDVFFIFLPSLAIIFSVFPYLSFGRMIVVSSMILFFTLIFMILSGVYDKIQDLKGLKERKITQGTLLKNEAFIGSRGVPYFTPVIELEVQGKKQIINLEKYKYSYPLVEGSKQVLLLPKDMKLEKIVVVSLNPYLFIIK